MDTNRIIQALDAEIDRLEQTRVLLAGRTALPRKLAQFNPLRLGVLIES